MSQKELYIQLLNEQLNKIDDRDFNLSSWKKASSIIIDSIFGSHSVQSKAIAALNYEYNSWALRDESGKADPLKEDCKACMNVIIQQLEIQTEPNPDDNTRNEEFDFIWTPFEDELTGSSLRNLKQLLQDKNTEKEDIEKFLKNLPDQTNIDILTSIITAETLKNWLNQNK
ncbi:hypothetical protein [Carboxylicivirga sp. N1Y90]|uniref:hypothetical protein n=1 Tax=Carboxylicivirga fragile TaxID=3417571 RepID=UPI003D34F8D1|nr:hypothetical protein [Marinilabiliaceae bacterium N1Y90]